MSRNACRNIVSELFEVDQFVDSYTFNFYKNLKINSYSDNFVLKGSFLSSLLDQQVRALNEDLRKNKLNDWLRKFKEFDNAILTDEEVENLIDNPDKLMICSKDLPLYTTSGDKTSDGFFVGEQEADGEKYCIFTAPDETKKPFYLNPSKANDLPRDIVKNSDVDGLKNSSALVSTSYTFPAAEHCYNSNSLGLNDWYLPAVDELKLMRQVTYNLPANQLLGVYNSSTLSAGLRKAAVVGEVKRMYPPTHPSYDNTLPFSVDSSYNLGAELKTRCVRRK